MATVGKFPDAELVVCNWIQDIPGIEVDGVDHQLPWDVPSPIYNGYVQVTVMSGVPNQYAGVFHTICQVDSWVSAPSEDRVYRLQASALAKEIQYAAYDRKNAKRAVFPQEEGPESYQVNYPMAHMSSVVCMTEPHVIISKENPVYEGYSMDMTFSWTTNIITN